jgi:hypothetical protein
MGPTKVIYDICLLNEWAHNKIIYDVHTSSGWALL